MGKERKEVEDKLSAYVDFDGMSLDGLAEEAAVLKEIVAGRGGIEGSGYIDYEYYGYDGGREMVVKYRRMETDKEYDKRLADEAKFREKEVAHKAKAKEARRREFEKLKKEFGDK